MLQNAAEVLVRSSLVQYLLVVGLLTYPTFVGRAEASTLRVACFELVDRKNSLEFEIDLKADRLLSPFKAPLNSSETSFLVEDSRAPHDKTYYVFNRVTGALAVNSPDRRNKPTRYMCDQAQTAF
jgi:hypothetical protein